MSCWLQSRTLNCDLPDMTTDQMHLTYLPKIQLPLTISLQVKILYMKDSNVM
jgi:hypothetical protein